MSRATILGLLVIAFAARLKADEVLLRDGSRLSGEVRRAGAEVSIRGRFGELRVPAAEVVAVRPADDDPPPAPPPARQPPRAPIDPAAAARDAVGSSAAAPAAPTAAAEIARLRSATAALARQLHLLRGPLAAG